MMLAELFDSWRHDRRLSIREAAKMIGVGAATLYRFEKGEPIEGATLAKILRWLL